MTGIAFLDPSICAASRIVLASKLFGERSKASLAITLAAAMSPTCNANFASLTKTSDEPLSNSPTSRSASEPAVGSRTPALLLALLINAPRNPRSGLDASETKSHCNVLLCPAISPSIRKVPFRLFADMTPMRIESRSPRIGGIRSGYLVAIPTGQLASLGQNTGKQAIFDSSPATCCSVTP